MIHYIRGDATAPVRTRAVIAHICNDMGAWGAGFTAAIDRRWTEPGRVYGIQPQHHLGAVRFVQVTPHICVANMVAQHGYGRGVRRVDDRALVACLRNVAQYARDRSATVHMPRIGCGLGGAKWEEIEPLVLEACAGVDVWVYDV